jgi:hypothetical protein
MIDEQLGGRGMAGTLETVLARMAQLEEEVRELRSGAAERECRAAGEAEDGPVSRRRFFTTAGAAAVGGVAGAVLGAAPAGATTGTMMFGDPNDAGNEQTTLTSSHGTNTFQASNTATGNTASVGVHGESTATSSQTAGVFGEANGAATVSGVRGITSSLTDSACGVRGDSNGATGVTFGVRGTIDSATADAAGVQGETGGTGATFGVRGRSFSTTAGAAGVRGDNGAYAVWGVNSGGSGTGVFGQATASGGLTYGVRGTTASTSANATGVKGEANGVTIGNAQFTFGVHGVTVSTSAAAAGVKGEATGVNGSVSGVLGVVSMSPTGTGVKGQGLAGNGVLGTATSGAGLNGLSDAGSSIVAQAPTLPDSGGAHLSLLAGSIASHPTGGAHTVGDFFLDSAGRLWQCTVSGTPGTWIDLTTGFKFILMSAPVRVWDSRVAGQTPALSPNTERDVPVTNGTTIPHGVSAVLVNLTAVNPNAKSFMAIFQDGIAWPGHSNLNYSAGATISNNATSAVSVATPGKVTVRNGASTSHFIVDVFGYYV